MRKPKPYTAADIKTDIEELDKVGADLLELAKKYKGGSIANEILISYYNQNLRKMQELHEKLGES